MLNDGIEMSTGRSAVPTLNKPNEEEFPKEISLKGYDSNRLDKHVDQQLILFCELINTAFELRVCSHTELNLLRVCSHTELNLLRVCSHTELNLLRVCSHTELNLLRVCSHTERLYLPGVWSQSLVGPFGQCLF